MTEPVHRPDDSLDEVRSDEPAPGSGDDLPAVVATDEKKAGWLWAVATSSVGVAAAVWFVATDARALLAQTATHDQGLLLIVSLCLTALWSCSMWPIRWWPRLHKGFGEVKRRLGQIAPLLAVLWFNAYLTGVTDATQPSEALVTLVGGGSAATLVVWVLMAFYDHFSDDDGGA